MTPRSQILIARIALAAVALVCGVAMIGPFQGAEKVLVPWDKAAHFLAFYGMTVGLFLAFPKRRRLDLAVLAAFAGSAVEIAQAMTGRDAGVGDMLANAAGAGAVLLPTCVEQWRAWTRAPLAARPAERRAPAVGALAPKPADTSAGVAHSRTVKLSN